MHKLFLNLPQDWAIFKLRLGGDCGESGLLVRKLLQAAESVGFL